MSKQATNQENGFSNFKPAGRDVRKIQGDRHLFEKNLLANRKEGFQRHDPNPNPLHVPVSAAGFQKGNAAISYCLHSSRYGSFSQ